MAFSGLVLLWPRSAPVLASAGPGASLGNDFLAITVSSRFFAISPRFFHDFFAICISFAHQPCPLVSFDPKLCVFVGHESLGDVPSMLAEICR